MKSPIISKPQIQRGRYFSYFFNEQIFLAHSTPSDYIILLDDTFSLEQLFSDGGMRTSDNIIVIQRIYKIFFQSLFPYNIIIYNPNIFPFCFSDSFHPCSISSKILFSINYPNSIQFIQHLFNTALFFRTIVDKNNFVFHFHSLFDVVINLFDKFYIIIYRDNDCQ